MQSVAKIKIKMLMVEANVTGVDIAKATQTTRSHVCHTIAGRRKSSPVRRAIADALNREVSDLFPDEE